MPPPLARDGRMMHLKLGALRARLLTTIQLLDAVNRLAKRRRIGTTEGKVRLVPYDNACYQSFASFYPSFYLERPS